MTQLEFEIMIKLLEKARISLPLQAQKNNIADTILDLKLAEHKLTRA